MKRDLKSQMLWCNRAQWTLGVGLLISISALCLFGIRPATARLATITAQVETARNELKAAQTRAATFPAAKQETEQLQQRVEQFDKKLPRHQNLPQLISDVTQISRRTSLSKLEWRPEPTLRRTDQFTEVPIEFTFQGDFLGVFNFLSQVEDMQRLTRLQKLDVQTKDGMDGQVEVQLTMNIYFSEE